MANFGDRDIREENVVTYEIYDLRSLSKEENEIRDNNDELYDILSYSQSLIQDYIWQKDSFNLRVHGDRDGGLDHGEDTGSIPCLKGSTDFADNIEDEWFIVYILQSISKKFPHVVVKINDNDGEFLLIECANFLPKWLEPETSDNRVFLHQGNLHIIPLPKTPSEIPVFPVGKPSVLQALKILLHNPEKTIALPWIQEPVMKRVAEYPNKTNFHHICCFLPKPLKYLLEKKTSLIAPVVRAFVNRDPVENKKCQELTNFPFEALVPHRVRFTRFLYAQLVKEDFIPTKSAMKMLPKISSTLYKAHVIGLQLTYGFEILCSQQSVIMKEDSTVMKPKGYQWEKYLDALKHHNYFQDELEGSKLYCQLMEKAKDYFTNNFLQRQVSSNIAVEIQELLKGIDDSISSDDIAADIREDDDESWLEISPSELESILSQYGSHISGGDTADLSNMVQGMNSFVEKISSYEGAEFPSELNDEDNIQFNADDVIQSMESFFLKQGKHSDSSDSESSNDGSDNMPEDEIYNEYATSMDNELSTTNIGKSFVKMGESSKDKDSDDQSKKSSQNKNDDMKPVDIDLNLVQNFLESFSLQEGMPGPVSNIFNSMGISLPQHLSENEQHST